jgi:hypothetical protein
MHTAFGCKIIFDSNKSKGNLKEEEDHLATCQVISADRWDPDFKFFTGCGRWF